MDNPLNVGLLVILTVLLVSNAFSGSMPIEAKQPSHPDVIEMRDFTPKELSVFNGRNGSKIYIAINRKVYDVSAKPDFYGPDSIYENFAGRDASRGLAKHSFEEEMLTDISKEIDDLKDLKKEEIEALRDWEDFYRTKYPNIGTLINEK